jgi:hypothetical protein
MENEAHNTAQKLVLHEVRQEIEQLPVENRIRIEAIARTLRNLLSQDPHAAMAFALVGAEEAAK